MCAGCVEWEPSAFKMVSARLRKSRLLQETREPALPATAGRIDDGRCTIQIRRALRATLGGANTCRVTMSTPGSMPGDRSLHGEFRVACEMGEAGRATSTTKLTKELPSWLVVQ